VPRCALPPHNRGGGGGGWRNFGPRVAPRPPQGPRPPAPNPPAGGPAPDEPATHDLRAARERIRAGLPLPATGRARWDPEQHDGGGEGPTAAAFPDAERDGEEPDGEERRRAREAEMDDLTDTLEVAARNAMTVLDDAMRAVEETTDDAADEPEADGADGDLPGSS
jgi:hypothetical protein